jgi:para-aminobenzoate synthetase component 1
VHAPRPITLSADPRQVFEALSARGPLAAIWSGADDDRSRWTIIAQPTQTIESRADAPALLEPPDWSSRAVGSSEHAHSNSDDAIPFVGGWLCVLGYALGSQLDRAAHARVDARWPASAWLRCDDALVYDRRHARWWLVGNIAPIEPHELRSARDRLHQRRWRAGPLISAFGRERYCDGVRTALEHIAAGDVYQLNLTHALRGPFDGSPRALFLDLMERARPWYGAYVELPDGRAIASASPELFLAIKPGGRIITRPMKGTFAGGSPSGAHALDHSAKERAELSMIVDLLRNDLGRVCAPGSVRVETLRDIERHATGAGPAGGLLQATATIAGKLETGTTLATLLRATFPGGSITGAPKLSAMKLIAQLEPEPRGVYCGAIGFFSRCGHAALNIAIRTACIDGHTLTYNVGAGIVADSDPAREWQETLDKARVLTDLCAPEAPR